jgi:DNA-binding response OmpR family regulator
LSSSFPQNPRETGDVRGKERALAKASRSERALLIVSDEARHGQTLASRVLNCGWRSTLCGSLDEATSRLARERYDIVLCEDTVRHGDLPSLISRLNRASQDKPIIVVSRKDDWEHYLAALAAGAAGYLAFPPYPGEVEQSLETAANLRMAMADAG